MNTTWFLSVDDLKKYSTINNNVEDKSIKRAIIDAENIDIQQILGTRLFLDIIETIKVDNSLSGTTRYKTLNDNYIRPCLLKYATHRSILYMWIKLRNKSVTQDNSDNSTPVDMAQFNKIRNDIMNDAEFYANKLKEYLCSESSTYPEYENYNPDSKDYYSTPNKRNSYFSGLYLK